MNFSDSLKLVMRRTGVTKQELARSTGYSQQHIYDLLNRKRRWNEESLNKVCSVLDIDIQIAPKQIDKPTQSLDVSDNHSKLTAENNCLKNQVKHLKDALKSLTEALD
ncbi:hypothetical protein B2I21_08610 [Chryseobacterium mucoviscidosis]|nr:hypothetical protein B2I21_08610 [Chryseobacterium mucoviscidosis]